MNSSHNTRTKRAVFFSVLLLTMLIPAKSSAIAGDQVVLNDQGSVSSIVGNHTLIPNWTATGKADYSYLGLSVAGAGDVNNDGFSDVIIGAPGHTVQAAYVFSGSATGLSDTPIWSVENQSAVGEFGYSVSSAGDVNKDGFGDVLVSDWLGNDGVGNAYVYLGSAAGLKTTPDWTSTGDGEYTYFGYWVSSAGDVNGDDYSDVVVTAFGRYTDTGKVSVYFGSAGGLSLIPNWVMTGVAASGDRFGTPVTSAGDVNGDGFDDLVVGAPYANQHAGQVFLYLGSAAGLGSTPAWTASGEASDNQFGISIARAGDVNGDGYDDLAVGAMYAAQNGKVYVYFGSSQGLSALPKWIAAGGLDAQEFGISVASAGDINHDGFSDLVIGSSTRYTFIGEAHLYLGGAKGLVAPLMGTATGETDFSHFGHSVSNAGDVNGDGYDDIMVGAYGFNDYAGKAYVFHGAPFDTTSPYLLHILILGNQQSH